MNPRERILAMCILAVLVLVAGSFLFVQLVLNPMRDKDASIAALQKDIETRQTRQTQILAEKPRLDRLRMLSLPADADLARREYEKYLNDLMRSNNFVAGRYSVTPRPADNKTSPTVGNKVPVYTKLAFAVQAHTNLANLVAMLEGFYKTGLLQQIKNIQIQRPLTTSAGQTPGDLDITFTVEALSLTGVSNRNYLLPNVDRRQVLLDAVAALRQAPVGLGMLTWAVGPAGPLGPGNLATSERNYESIAHKNVFMGPQRVEEPREDRSSPEVEITRFVHLTDITKNDRRSEAYLYDRYSNKRTRLRSEAGFDTFKITDGDGEAIVRGKVIKIEPRDLIFRVDENYFNIHLGQTLEESMRKPLSGSELQALGLGKQEERASPGGE